MKFAVTAKCECNVPTLVSIVDMYTHITVVASMLLLLMLLMPKTSLSMLTWRQIDDVLTRLDNNNNNNDNDNSPSTPGSTTNCTLNSTSAEPCDHTARSDTNTIVCHVRLRFIPLEARLQPNVGNTLP